MDYEGGHPDENHKNNHRGHDNESQNPQSQDSPEKGNPGPESFTEAVWLIPFQLTGGVDNSAGRNRIQDNENKKNYQSESDQKEYDIKMFNEKFPDPVYIHAPDPEFIKTLKIIRKIGDIGPAAARNEKTENPQGFILPGLFPAGGYDFAVFHTPYLPIYKISVNQK
jgi:hypothetical protein